MTPTEAIEVLKYIAPGTQITLKFDGNQINENKSKGMHSIEGNGGISEFKGTNTIEEQLRKAFPGHYGGGNGGISDFNGSTSIGGGAGGSNSPGVTIYPASKYYTDEHGIVRFVP